MTDRSQVAPTLAATTLVFLTLVIGGSYTLERAGVEGLGWLDLRLVGLVLGCSLLAYESARAPRPQRSAGRPEGWLVAASLLFLLQISSGLWAGGQARVGAQATDILIMATVTVAFYLHARRDPLPVAQRILWFFFVVGLVFAVAAAAAGPGVQGRFSAFGGGPNVFVRFQVLGLMATVALVGAGASRLLLAALPIFAVGAVLSGSRGGLLAAAVVVGLAVGLGGPRVRRSAVPFAVAGVGVLAASASVFPALAALLQSRFVEQTGGQVYTSGRPEIWSQALGLAREHPFGGVGLDGYYGLIGSQTGIEHPHNYPLAVLAETGGAAALLLVLVCALWGRTLRAGDWRGVHAQAMILSACFVAVAGLTSGHYYDARLGWLFAAAAAATTGRVLVDADAVDGDA